MADLPPAVQTQVKALESFDKDLDATLAIKDSANSPHDPNAWFLGGMELQGWALKALASPTDKALPISETKDVKPFASRLKELVALRIIALKEEADAGRTSLPQWLSQALHEAAMKRTTANTDGTMRAATMTEINKWVGPAKR